MPKAPKTYDELRTDISLSVREALVAAAVLPNLPPDESLIAIRGYTALTVPKGKRNPGRMYHTDADELEAFRHRHDPIVPGGELYRVKTDHETYRRYDVKVTPVPHAFRDFEIHDADFIEVASLDADEYDFDDIPFATLEDFGGSNPYYNPYHANRDAFDRDPKLPV